jgi:hypothetical protein
MGLRDVECCLLTGISDYIVQACAAWKAVSFKILGY